MSSARLMRELALRPLGADDLPAIHEIETRAYDYPWSDGIFSDCLRVGYSVWGGFEDESLRAYCVMSVAVNEAHVLNLCVDPTFHGLGFGGRLLEQMMAVARHRQAQRMLLEVRPSNWPALALYRRLGFRQIGLRRGYYPAAEGREDALVLSYRL